MAFEKQDFELEKNHYYRDQYRRTLSWLSMMAVACVGLSAVLAYITIDQKKSNYYATTTSGLVIPMRSLSEPIVTSSYLLQWAGLATRKAFNLDFVHYQSQLEQAKVYFTPHGWEQFLAALDKSKLLAMVQEKKLMTNAVLADTPVVLNRSVLHGRYTWRIQLPFLITFSSASEEHKMRMMVTANVQRVSVLDTSQGILINDFVADRQTIY